MTSALENKVAVVTGASKGIGREIARSFGAAGASVVVTYASSKEGADAVVEAITESGAKAVAIQGDVSKAADAEKIVAAAIESYGRLDILVNNAGIYDWELIEAVTEESCRRQFDTNVLGVLLTIRAALKHLSAGASIINIGSGVTATRPPSSSVYAATKAAVDAITGVLSKELGARQIRVNCLKPGLVETEGTHSFGIIGTDFEKQRVAQTPLGRVGQPSDIASIAVFLASDASGWLTGELLYASGGVR